MTKTSATSTLPPELFAFGREVLNEDAIKVCEMLNYALTTRPLAHVSLACGDDNWVAGSLQTLRIRFNTASGWQEKLRFRIKIPAETIEVRAGARCFMPAANTGLVRVTVGAASAVTLTSFTNATNGTEHSTVITLVGSGYQEVLVEMNHSVGADLSYLRTFRLEEVPLVAASLLDPGDD